MTDHKNDSELNNYLSGNSDLSKLYQASNKNDDPDNLNEPSLNLDSAILAAAKREVNSKPVKSKKNYSPFSNNYFIPVSTAASIFIVVLLVSLFPEKQQIEFEPSPELSLAPATTALPVAPMAEHAEFEENIKLKLLDSSLVEKKTVSTKPQKLLRKKSNDIQRTEEVSSIKNKQKAKVAQRTRSPQAKKETLNLNLNKIAPIELNKKQTKADDSRQSKFSEMKSESAPVMELDSEIIESEMSESSADDYSNDYEESEVYYSEMEQSMGASTLDANSAQAMSSFVADSSYEQAENLVYDEQRWKILSSEEWLKRIKEIYRLYGESETKIVIEHFNKKFPKLKTNVDDFKSSITK